jgi:iron complex outermembrane recepter protein
MRLVLLLQVFVRNSFSEIFMMRVPLKNTLNGSPKLMMLVGLQCALLQPFHLSAQTASPTQAAKNETGLTTINVTAPRSRTGDGVLDESPIAVGIVTVITSDEINKVPSAGLDEVMQRAGQASVDAGGSFGLISGSSLRGFAAQRLGGVSSSKILLNGHPDVADAFNRDMSTVERVVVLGGFDSTLIGAGNPGGMIQFQTKQPSGRDATDLGWVLGSTGLVRAVIDTEKSFGGLQLRLVAASQRGQKTIEGVKTDRDNVLLASKLATPLGIFRIEAEYAKNQSPFVFGTFYANGGFLYDKPYVSPQSTASRETKRGALYWEHKIGENTIATAWMQRATVRRKESLVGFFTPNDDTVADGYYRPIDSAYRQSDAGLLLKTRASVFGFNHALTASASRQTQNLEFTGPQSIGDYLINIQAPVWPIDLTQLTLTPYHYRGTKTESGIGVADSIDVTEKLQVRLGVRYSTVNIRSSDDATKPDKLADVAHWTHSEGLAYRLTGEDKVWLSRATSFVPALGQTKDGSVLPPQTAKQIELGYAKQLQNLFGSVSVFEVEQKNLPGVDPTNKSFLIPVGTVRSQGISISSKLDALGLTWKANTTYQSVRNTQPVRASQGAYLAGVPQVIGALTVSTLDSKPQGIGAWLTAFGVGKRAADSQRTLFASGYVRWDAGLSFIQGAWRYSATVQNLFDRRYIQSLDASDNAWQGARRQLQIAGNYRF